MESGDNCLELLSALPTCRENGAIQASVTTVIWYDVI